jgi:hypothetical protein
MSKTLLMLYVVGFLTIFHELFLIFFFFFFYFTTSHQTSPVSKGSTHFLKKFSFTIQNYKKHIDGTGEKSITSTAGQGEKPFSCCSSGRRGRGRRVRRDRRVRLGSPSWNRGRRHCRRRASRLWKSRVGPAGVGLAL